MDIDPDILHADQFRISYIRQGIITRTDLMAAGSGRHMYDIISDSRTKLNFWATRQQVQGA